jgi:1-acyl-sn-glycerol-3-phosphate acyltransferase
MTSRPLGAVGETLGRLRTLLSAPADEDAWGYDAAFVRAFQPSLDVLYDRWWRVTATGMEHVPQDGRALIATNHAGVVPWDGAMLATAIRRHNGRDARSLVLNWAFELPWISTVIRRSGGVPASPENARRLLEEDHLVLVFPEGAKGIAKPYSERYRLQRFGRGGFVETALRAQAQIIPCAVVGSEEIHPKIAEAPGLAKLLGAPYLPITPTFPLLGPLGAVPLPSRWRIEFCAPVDLSAYGPDAAADRRLVLELSDAIREQIQAKVFENLIKREGAFL